MLGDETLALGRAPRNTAQDTAVLLERHLEMPLLHPPRTVDDLDSAGAEDRTRIAGAERRQRRQLGHDLFVDRAERQRTVNPEARAEIVRSETAVGIFVDARAQL